MVTSIYQTARFAALLRYFEFRWASLYCGFSVCHLTDVTIPFDWSDNQWNENLNEHLLFTVSILGSQSQAHYFDFIAADITPNILHETCIISQFTVIILVLASCH